MTQRTLSANLFGRQVSFEYSEKAIAYAIIGTRVVMGWIFLQAGLEKLFAPEPWTAAGFLQFGLPEGNPFAAWFTSMAGNATVDALVIWGQILIGACLILGLFTRGAAFWGAVQMILFWMTSLMGGLSEFLPLEHGWVVDDHLVYAAILYFLGAIGAGRILGLDSSLENTEFVKNNSWVKFITG